MGDLVARARALSIRVFGRSDMEFELAAADSMEDAIREAVEEEREACAAIVNSAANTRADFGQLLQAERLNDIARRIRSRSKGGSRG